VGYGQPARAGQRLPIASARTVPRPASALDLPAVTSERVTGPVLADQRVRRNGRA
jgi:hypothetical protein